MFWHIDSISRETVSGWVYDREHPDFDFELAVLDGDSVLGRGTANLARPDLLKAGHKKEHSGFSISLRSAPANLSRVRVVCLALPSSFDTFVLHDPDPAKAGTLISPYQSFAGSGPGASHSVKKLASLALPRIKGRSVLDLGCNEGFFCHHAYRKGARRVLGLDQSGLCVEKARLRFPGVRAPQLEFRSSSWWDLPDEQFDIILFLSAIHYEQEQKKLLDTLARHLTPGGVLVLECGVAQGSGESWVHTQRGIDVRRFPTYPLLMDTLLESYAVRHVGSSVAQRGDPIPRRVFHCMRKKPVVGLCYARSGAGKSTLLRFLRKRGSVPAFSSDDFFSVYRKGQCAIAPDTPLYKMIAGELDDYTLYLAAEKIIALDAVQEFCRDFVTSLPLDQDLSLVEGEVFNNPVIRRSFIKEVKKAGVMVWEITRA